MFFPCGWSKPRIDFFQEMLWVLQKYPNLNCTRSTTTCSNRVCSGEEVELEMPRSSFQSTQFCDSVHVKLNSSKTPCEPAEYSSSNSICFLKLKLHDGENKHSNNQSSTIEESALTKIINLPLDDYQ